MKKIFIFLFVFSLVFLTACSNKPKKNDPVVITFISEDVSLGFMKLNYPDYVEDSELNLEKNREMYEKVINITNEYRNELNVPALVHDPELTMLAQIRAEEIAATKKTSHTRPYDKGYFSTLLNEYGKNKGKAGENIAWGYETTEIACQNWKASKTHYDNLMKNAYTKTGVGIASYDNGTYVFVQLFGSAET